MQAKSLKALGCAAIVALSARAPAQAPGGLDLGQLDPALVQQGLQMLQMAHFPIAYEAIMNDGTKGAALSEWACGSLRFRDPMKTFAGGTLTVRIVSADDNTVLFEQSVEIPENKDA